MDEQKKYYNTQEVAEMMGILRASVRRKAHKAGIGTLVNERAMIFTPEEVVALKELPDGRGKWQKNGGKTRNLQERKHGTFVSRKELAARQRHAEQAAAVSPSP